MYMVTPAPILGRLVLAAGKVRMESDDPVTEEPVNSEPVRWRLSNYRGDQYRCRAGREGMQIPSSRHPDSDSFHIDACYKCIEYESQSFDVSRDVKHVGDGRSFVVAGMTFFLSFGGVRCAVYRSFGVLIPGGEAIDLDCCEFVSRLTWPPS